MFRTFGSSGFTLASSRLRLAWLLVWVGLNACGCASLKERTAERIEYILSAPSARPGMMVPFHFKLPPEANAGQVIFLKRKYHVFPRRDLQERIFTAFLAIPANTPTGDYPILCSFTVTGAAGRIEESFDFHVQAEAADQAPERVKAPGFGLKAYQADYALISQVLKKAARPEERPPVFILPQSGRLTALYGARRIYNQKDEISLRGVEIEPVASGIWDVSAAADGKVLLARNLPMLGNTVIMDHGLAFATLYAHLAKLEVSEGQAVKRGHMLGRVGRTGKAAVGQRLLYQVFIEGVEVNPLKYADTN